MKEAASNQPNPVAGEGTSPVTASSPTPMSATQGTSGLSAPPPSAKPPLPHVPDHELLRRIGGGSYGEVWVARNKLGTLRAVKVVYRSTFEDSRPFEREFKGIQKFEPISRSHEGLVDILQVGGGEEYFYYVMELADAAGMTNDEIRNPKEARNPNDEKLPASRLLQASGFGFPSSFDIRHSELYAPRTLRHDLKQRGRLPVDECVRIGHSLASALAHLHAQGLVHRDVKPSNIIFVGGVAKLADIGLVADVSEARSFVGTEGFIPPEGPGTPQADLYSLGKVLYEISTGKDRRDFPALPDDLAEDAMLELNAVILKACKTEPRERYQSAEDMLHELDLLQRGKSIRRKRIKAQRLSIGRKLSLVALTVALLITGLPLVRTLHQGKPQNPEAKRRYELGRYYYDKLTAEDHQKAINHLNKAIQIDPKYVPAYRLLFEINVWGLDGGENRQAISRQLASKLMALDPKLADAHMALSWVKYGDGDWRGAEEEIQQALRFNPNYANAHGIYGYYLALLGRTDEANEQLRRAQDLEPASRIFALLASYPFITARHYELALAQLQRALELETNFPAAYLFLGRVYEAQSNFVAAIKAFKSYDVLAGRHATEATARYEALGQAYSTAGARGYWLKLLEFRLADDALPRDEKIFFPADRWALGGIYAQLGEKEKALDQLEREFRENGGDDWLKFEPLHDPLHDEHRFKALLKRAGLEK